MQIGIVVKAYGGFYYVQSEKKVWECVLRGRFRVAKQHALVGDKVEFREKDHDSGTIERIFPRRTVLNRPMVANVDNAIIVFAARDPHPNALLLDLFLIQSEEAAIIKSFICFNKVDLGMEEIEELVQIYQKAGYEVLATSAKEGTGLERLREILYNGIAVMAGPSGVGKSSLLKAISPSLYLKTGEVSSKSGQGRHTTRHVELLRLPEGGLVVDTPGFSRLGLPEIKLEEMASYFPEFQSYICNCQFSGCLHFKEPGCSVKMAVEDGRISAQRYNNYVGFLNIITEQKRRY